MNPWTIFFSWNGRMARRPYWIGIAPIEGVVLATGFIIGLTGGGSALLVSLIFAYPRICVISKRLHDLNHSGWWQVIPNMAGNALAAGANAVPETSPFMMIGLGLMSLVIEIGFLTWLGCVKGQSRSNDYGAAPGTERLVDVF